MVVATLRLPANDKDDDNDMIPGAVHRCPGIYLAAEENPGKLMRRSYCPWTFGLRPKNFKLVWRCPHFLSRFLANSHLPLVSHLSANDKINNEVIPGAVHVSPGIDLTAEENQGNHQLRDFRRRLCHVLK